MPSTKRKVEDKKRKRFGSHKLHQKPYKVPPKASAPTAKTKAEKFVKKQCSKNSRDARCALTGNTGKGHIRSTYF